MRNPNGKLLELTGLTKHFSGLVALDAVSLRVQEGQIKGLIGPNGAGKTTLFNCIGGALPPTSGDIFFRGESILGLPPYEIAQRGICRTFQNIQTFAGMTVLENVLVGCHLHMNSGILAAAVRSRGMRSEERVMTDRALKILDDVGLIDWESTTAENLPLGLQRMLEIARALAASPKLLLLDEPASGLNSTEKEQLGFVIRKICREGVTIFLVEHDMDVLMGLADDVAVLNFGMLLAQGTPDEVQKNSEVIAAYLGTADHVA
jgi:branched-chain amino acid transport system ATP-binding protein